MKIKIIIVFILMLVVGQINIARSYRITCQDQCDTTVDKCLLSCESVKDEYDNVLCRQACLNEYNDCYGKCDAKIDHKTLKK